MMMGGGMPGSGSGYRLLAAKQSAGSVPKSKLLQSFGMFGSGSGMPGISSYGSGYGIRDVGSCGSGCPEPWLGDGWCDAACNTPECKFDGGDCQGSGSGSGPTPGSGSGFLAAESEVYHSGSGSGGNMDGPPACIQSCAGFDLLPTSDPGPAGFVAICTFAASLGDGNVPCMSTCEPWV